MVKKLLQLLVWLWSQMLAWPFAFNHIDKLFWFFGAKNSQNKVQRSHSQDCFQLTQKKLMAISNKILYFLFIHETPIPYRTVLSLRRVSSATLPCLHSNFVARCPFEMCALKCFITALTLLLLNGLFTAIIV